ncbi:MAG: hypothetical protein JO187_08570 [Acidobacteria bacterium]|nr:hypothetical protein [Acidobacteriota bacterium]
MPQYALNQGSGGKSLADEYIRPEWSGTFSPGWARTAVEEKVCQIAEENARPRFKLYKKTRSLKGPILSLERGGSHYSPAECLIIAEEHNSSV